MKSPKNPHVHHKKHVTLKSPTQFSQTRSLINNNSQVNLHKSIKKITTSVQKNDKNDRNDKNQISNKLLTMKSTKTLKFKNDLKIVPIYVESTGFIIEYNTLPYGIKCQCYLDQQQQKPTNTFQSNQFLSKSSSQTNLFPQQQKNKTPIPKKTKYKQLIQINLTQSIISIIKNHVEHKFYIHEKDNKQSKKDYLKIFIGENWQWEQFVVVNKKVKVIQQRQFKAMFIHKINNKNITKLYDQIYPLKKVQQSNFMRMFKLKKSQSKINITWSNQTTPSPSDYKQPNHIINLNQSHNTQNNINLINNVNNIFHDKSIKILSFTSKIHQNNQKSQNLILKYHQKTQRNIINNQNDQTKDSQDQDIVILRNS